MAGDRRRWWMLALGMGAQAASCVFLYGLPYLVPDLRHQFGLSLTAASTLVAAPLIGVIVALVAWGALADRYGERLVITAGLAIAGGALIAASRVSGAVSVGLLLGCAGAGGASVNAASGRLVLGWFGAAERGLAMGARQTAQPLGTMLAAATLPAIAARSGLAGALGACGLLCLVAAAVVAIFAADPPRPSRAGAGPAANPYRAPTLWRIHAASMLLVVPQFATTGFALEYLVTGRGWSAVDAGRVIAIANLAGALTRLLAGKWSDRAMSRLRPMRWLACAVAVVMGACALGMWWRSPLAVGALLAAIAVSVSTNGLAFTAVAEIAGMSWAGRALGVQNTGQNVAAAATPPVMAQLIELAGYGGAFGLGVLFPIVAIFAIPVRAEPPPLRPPRPRSGRLRSGTAVTDAPPGPPSSLSQASSLGVPPSSRAAWTRTTFSWPDASAGASRCGATLRPSPR
ncbi:MAG: MFS transporter [Streptosporangiaceae bacterium]